MTDRIFTDANGRKYINNEPRLHPPQRKPLTEDMVHRAMVALNTASCGELQPTFDEMKAALEAAHGIGEIP